MNDISLIANSGIQLYAFSLKLNTQDAYSEGFHEWYDPQSNDEDSKSAWKLELVYKYTAEGDSLYFNKADLLSGGYLPDDESKIDEEAFEQLKGDGILPIYIPEDGESKTNYVYDLKLAKIGETLSCFENKWLPLPYFTKRAERRFKFGPLNWCRAKFIPIKEVNGVKDYNVLIAFDTRTTYEDDSNLENPVFSDKFRKSIDLGLCDDELYLLDFCATGKEWSFIDELLMNLVHPGVTNVDQLKKEKHKMEYVATYIFLLTYLAKKRVFPNVKLYRDIDVEKKSIDMVVDIGNSKTTALLIEDNTTFNQVRQLQLIDYTNPIINGPEGVSINHYDEPFDMRIAFRKETFGNFGFKDSRQFVCPSLVRLGHEANHLIHLATAQANPTDTLSTYSSPKRYLWDSRPNKEEWTYLVLPGETDDHILNLNGITSQLKSDGRYAPDDDGGLSFHYSRQSLMTLAFMEMLSQAHVQINSITHRSVSEGLGHADLPRKIKRIIVTCPTAMSKIEREALIRCAQDAVNILANFYGWRKNKKECPIEVIPEVHSRNDDDTLNWYYDEATCSQLVYMYGEVGHKYKGCCAEYFNLYGKTEAGETQPSVTVGSIDIGAGTSDLMISRYTYQSDDVTTITPEPLFYDSYYYAGDDMLNGLIKNVMLLDETSAFRQALKNKPFDAYRQIIKNFFGCDYNGQSLEDRILRKDFNIQYSVPLMCHFLELVSSHHKDCVVRYADVFSQCSPSQNVIDGFKVRTGVDVTQLQWSFNLAKVSTLIEKEFEPLLKKIATIMYAKACDIVLLSGRPSSLPPIRDIFLKYYAVSPNRLIILNNYYVGYWYPFSNNTGYITNPKTIVAMGGVIGHYAAELSNLYKFAINLDKLKHLKSTVNYIAATRDGSPEEYIITQTKMQGNLIVSSLPAHLIVRQLELNSYPCRALYSIDFNRYKLADRIKRTALIKENKILTDANVLSLVNDKIEVLSKQMPFKLTIERDAEDKENLSITSIVDKKGNDINESDIEIHIQSLGISDQYWLDSGAFNF
jgi:hypothetical protein